MTTDEVPVAQIDDDADTLITGVDERIMRALRAGTCSEWPPEPPEPAEIEAVLAEGTVPPSPPERRAAIYAAVRRPTTSGDFK